MAVTVQNIKDSVEDIDLITHGNNEVVTRCLDNATIYVDTVALEAGRTITDATKDAIVKKRTLYELYIYSQDFQQAGEYKEDAETMLKAALGMNTAGEPIKKPTPTAYVIAGRTDWNGY